jgi:hypothetical protein
VKRSSLAFLLGVSLAAANPVSANPLYDGALGVLIDLAGTILGARLFVPANDKLDPGPTNTFVGFQSQACEGPNFASTVPGGQGLPCVPNGQYPPFGAGLLKAENVTPDDCMRRAGIGAAALKDTVLPGTDRSVPEMQINDPNSGFASNSGVGFANPGAIFVTGGVCSPAKANLYGFAGTLAGKTVLKAPGTYSDIACAYLVNMCTEPLGCSCDNHKWP